jgi:hypothetical protein
VQLNARRAAFATLTLGAALGALACDQVANLDVGYRDAASDAKIVDAASLDAGEGGQPLEGCPCDETQGLGCCVPKVGTPYCTTDRSMCDGDKGLLLSCLRANASTESACCWHQGIGGEGATTAYAALCDGGAPACVFDSDCTGTTCATTTCAGVTLGACGAVAPACP